MCAPVATTSRAVNRNRETACACEEGAPAERATAREAGELLKSEKNSALENNFYTVAEGENFRERKLRSGETFLKSEKNSVLEKNFYTVAEGEKFRERELRSAEKF